MEFDLRIEIDVPQDCVFSFLRDKHLTQRAPGSAVLILEKTTSGPVGVGTRYREVVRMLPWYQGEILSVITAFREGEQIEEVFSSAGMTGTLEYQFIPRMNGTELIQRQQFEFNERLVLFLPLIRLLLANQLKRRLSGIKRHLEELPANLVNP